MSDFVGAKRVVSSARRAQRSLSCKVRAALPAERHCVCIPIRQAALDTQTTSGLVIILSDLYVPSLMNSYAVPFDAFGVAIALGFWIWMIAGVIVIGAIVMAELAGLGPTPTRE